MEGEEYTAFCGLYCRDCIPSHRRFFAAVRELRKMLDDLQFRHYAELKSGRHPAFRKYGAFQDALAAIAELECPAPCTQGGGKADCPVRQCVLSKGYRGCWECEGRTECEPIRAMLAVHPNLLRHLDLIRSKGLTEWLKERKSHYRWQA
jgi:hypothetical protein